MSTRGRAPCFLCARAREAVLALGLAAGILAACADPEVRVRIRVPPAQRDAVATVSVEVHQPPGADPFGCDELAFGSVADQVQNLSRERVVSLTEGSGSIGPIDRLNTTLLVARALSADGRAEASGCVVLAPFDSDVELQMELEPVLVLSRLTSHVAAPLGSPLKVEMEVKDLQKNPAAGAGLRWLVVGARNERTMDSGTADDLGQIQLALATPEAAGPVAIQVRARWATNNPAVIRGFVRPQQTPTVVAPQGTAVSYATGRFAADGGWAVAAVVQTRGRSALRYCSGTGPVVCSAPHPLPEGGLIARVTSGREDRLLLATRQDVRLFRQSTQENLQAHGATAPERFLSAGACPNASEAVLVFADGQRQDYDARGAQLQGSRVKAITGNLATSGCVSTDDGDVRRAFLSFTNQASGLWLVPADGGALSSLPWRALGPPVAFTQPFAGEQLVLSIKSQVDELVLARGKVTVPEQEVKTSAYDWLPRFPAGLASGDFDGDGALDVVALLDDEPALEPPSFGLWMVLATKTGPTRVSGFLSLEGAMFCEPRVLVADLDGDAADEIVVVGSGSCPDGGLPQPPARMVVLDLSPEEQAAR